MTFTPPSVRGCPPISFQNSKFHPIHNPLPIHPLTLPVNLHRHSVQASLLRVWKGVMTVWYQHIHPLVSQLILFLNCKMKNCCKSTPKNRQCVRKSNKKVFTLPRKFTKLNCLTRIIRGFTMRASCAPFKNCRR